jgi:predicted house-cleaning NTP pyrophosphatase (Maf/HAM1 superfamily)
LDEYFGMVRLKEVSASEMAKLLNAQVFKITKAKTIDEARELVVKWCKEKRYKLVEVRPPVELEFFKEGLVYFIEPEPKCLLEVKAVEKPATPKAEYYILRTCSGRVMLASNVDNTWYVVVV